MDIIDIILGAKLGGGGGSGGGSSSFVPSFGTIASVSLGTTWSGNDPYTSTVTVTGYTVTDKTMVSVLPSTAALTQMLSDGTSNIYITNNNGTLTATALGAAPTQAMTLTVLCSESDQAAAIGNLAGIVGDGVIETLQAADLTDAVNQLGSDVSDAKNAISQKEDALSIVQKTSSDVTITLEEDKFYIFPTMTELTVTCPLTGLYGFRFTSGTTPTVFLMSGITMPDNWNGTEASKTYDMTILNGLALVTSWSV